MPPLMIVNQDHPSALVPFVPTDDNVANMGSVNNIASISINCSSDHHDVQDVHVNSFSSDFFDIDTEEVLETLIQAAFNSPNDREPNAGVEVERMKTTEVAAADMDADVEEKLQCDFNTTHHHDVVALPNVESMVETTEVLEEEEGVDWLRDFPQFELADLEFSDWEADAWDNEFVLFVDYALCKIYRKGSKASIGKSSTVIGHQLREIGYNFNSVCAKEGLEEDYMVPQDVHVNSFSSDFCDIDTQEVLIQAAFNSPDDREPNAGVEVERMTTTEVAAANMDADVEEKLQCDFNTTHPDVVTLPNVESMVETTEVLEEEEGVDCTVVTRIIIYLLNQFM
ncbi:hypothetical protein Sjap_017487 [Stephania japonica]|uniref:Uncharacterized protein n=1 Tax=Stephania japonica TaxID=461633 RepID=A0AAP0I693_9MAGN